MNGKLLIVGWDGATWDYIDPLLAQGDLPNLAALLERGVRATMRSTAPPFTNIAWPSMVTGLSPAQTGVYDAVRTMPGTYDRVPTNLEGFRGIPIWHWANRYGRSAGVLNVPMTHPAHELEGCLVSGFDTPVGANDAAYPPSILGKWAEQGHVYDVLDRERALMDHQNPHQQRLSLEEFTTEWVRLTIDQGEHAAWLLRTHPVDLAFVVLSGTDSINHRTRDVSRIGRVYQAADAALGTILAAVNDDALICLVSDHGSTPAHNYIALNRLLHDAGWLHFRPELSERTWRRLPAAQAKTGLSVWRTLPPWARRMLSWPWLQIDARLGSSADNIDWARTKVYARSSLGPLYINLEGREPEGCVPLANYGSLRAEVIHRLSEAQTPDGRRLFRRVWRIEELYPQAKPDDHHPDILLEPADWRDHMITGYPSDPVVRPIPARTEYGTHTPDGTVALAGPRIRHGARLGTINIVDAMPTLLAAWGLPVPAETDGRVVEDAFVTPPVVQSEPSGPEAERIAARAGGTNVLDRLRALGYVE